MNLQIIMIVVTLIAGLGLTLGNIMTNYDVQAVIAIFVCALFTCSFMLGLYTINLFATKPHDPKLGQSGGDRMSNSSQMKELER